MRRPRTPTSDIGSFYTRKAELILDASIQSTLTTRPEGSLLTSIFDEVWVKTLPGKTISLRCSPWHTIDHVKSLVEKREGVPPVDQRIIFCGKQLEVNRTISGGHIESLDRSLRFILFPPRLRHKKGLDPTPDTSSSGWRRI